METLGRYAVVGAPGPYEPPIPGVPSGPDVGAGSAPLLPMPKSGEGVEVGAGRPASEPKAPEAIAGDVSAPQTRGACDVCLLPGKP